MIWVATPENPPTPLFQRFIEIINHIFFSLATSILLRAGTRMAARIIPEMPPHRPADRDRFPQNTENDPMDTGRQLHLE
jgi:hypothetical protein